jgi:hypothetical protein
MTTIKVKRPWRGQSGRKFGFQKSPRISISFPEDDFNQIAELADECGVTFAEAVRKIVRASLE